MNKDLKNRFLVVLTGITIIIAGIVYFIFSFWNFIPETNFYYIFPISIIFLFLIEICFFGTGIMLIIAAIFPEKNI